MKEEQHRGFSYFPTRTYAKLVERSTKNYRSIGKEIAFLVEKGLQYEETQQQEQPQKVGAIS